MVTDHPVSNLSSLPPAEAIFFDLAPSAASRIAGDQLPNRYRKKLERFRHGPGVFKIDWALDGPIPWKHSDAMRAGRVPRGGAAEHADEVETVDSFFEDLIDVADVTVIH